MMHLQHNKIERTNGIFLSFLDKKYQPPACVNPKRNLNVMDEKRIELVQRWNSKLVTEDVPPVPDDKRERKDCWCCWIFIGFVLLMLGLSIFALVSGRISQMITPYDADGKECGKDYPEYPYLYFASPKALDRTTCVKICPADDKDALQCQTNSQVEGCGRDLRDHFNFSRQTLVYSSQLYLSRYCLPETKHISDIMVSSFNFGQVRTFLTIRKFWFLLLAFPLLSIVLNILCLYLIKHWPREILALLLAAWYASLLAAIFYNVFRPIDYASIIILVIAVLALALSLYSTYDNWQYRDAIISITQCAAEFVFSSIWTITLHPLRSLLSVAYLVPWMIILLFIISLGSSDSVEAKRSMFHVEYSFPIVLLIGLHVFLLLWVSGIVTAMVNYMIAGGVATWFFSNQNSAPDGTFSTIASRMRRYHMGSICLSSSLTMVLEPIFDLFLGLVPNGQLEGWRKTALEHYTNCCETCLDNVYCLVKSESFSFMYMFGSSYFVGSKQTHLLLWREPFYQFFSKALTSVFRVIRLEICLLSCQFCLIAIKLMEPRQDVLGFLLVLFGLTYLIGAFMTQTLEAACESVLICKLVVKELELKSGKQLAFDQEINKIITKTFKGLLPL